MVTPLIILISSQIAVHSDRNADLVSHTQCQVEDKGKSSKKYQVKTSCGDFSARYDIYIALEVGSEYDFAATPGNWARKAHIMEATPSTESY